MNLLGTIYKNEPHLAVQVRAHIARGEDVNTVTQYCESPLRVASNNGRFDVVKILLEAGADAGQLEWTPTFFEVAYGDLDSIKESVETHQDIEGRDFWQRVIGDRPRFRVLRYSRRQKNESWSVPNYQK